MNLVIRIGGNVYAAARYNRQAALDKPGATWSAFFESCDEDLWSEVEIEEDGERVLTGYLLSRTYEHNGVQVTGSDTYIRAHDTMVETDLETEIEYSSYDYVEYLLELAGLSHDISIDLSDQGVEPNIQLGPGSVHEAIMSVVKYAGVFIWVDALGVVHVDNLPEGPGETYNGFMRHERELSDETTRHTIKVYGTSSGSHIFTRIFGKSAGDDLGDPVERIGVISSPHIRNNEEAEAVADAALEYYNSHDDVRTIVLDGFRPELYVPQILTDDDGEAKHITQVNSNVDETGATATVVLDRRAGMFDYQRYRFGPAIQTTLVRPGLYGDVRVYHCENLSSGEWVARDNGEFDIYPYRYPDFISCNPANPYETIVGDDVSSRIWRWADISDSGGEWEMIWDGDSEMPWSAANTYILDMKYDTSGNIWVLLARWSGDADNDRVAVVKADHNFTNWEIMSIWNPYPEPNYVGLPDYDPEKPYRPDRSQWSDRQRGSLFVSGGWLVVAAYVDGNYYSRGSSAVHHQFCGFWRVNKLTGSTEYGLDFFSSIGVPTTGVTYEGRILPWVMGYGNSGGNTCYLNARNHSYNLVWHMVDRKYYQYVTNDFWNTMSDSSPSTWPEDAPPDSVFCDFGSGPRQSRLVMEDEWYGGGTRYRTHYNTGAGWNTFQAPSSILKWLPGQERIVFASSSNGIRWTSDYGNNYLSGPSMPTSWAPAGCTFHDELIFVR